ncbi:glycosyltransferase family 25 protein [Puniceibacterium sediminis]|uniref:Glycosyl transferase, family 25 n=1 Tax=Puniceibacterium sediminis TaxID=1608407 RepID=A0A238Y529_9RHOB|nr:glycosyltransferase family 25 protein [Puniceibacterium sediminis]SNR66082.1 glycosyl transferase, family 25 [Puniceibacterium sediminis]
MPSSLFVQIINLDRSVARYEHISAACERAGLAHERLSAVDGSQLDLTRLEGYRAWQARLYYGRVLSAGELGCYMSHLNAARRFLQSGQEFGLVLEDDAEIAPDLVARLEAVIAQLGAAKSLRWDVVNLCNAPKHEQDRTALFQCDGAAKGHVIEAAHVFPKRTTALLWSRDGAAWFVEEGAQMRAPVDQFLHSAQSKRGRGLSLRPVLIPYLMIESDINAMAGAQEVRQVGRRSLWYEMRARMRKVQGRKHGWAHRRAGQSLPDGKG